MGTATARMTRVLFIGAALTGLAFSGLSAQRAVRQMQYVHPAWGAIVWALLWAAPVVFILLSWRAPLPWLRAASIVYVIAYTVAILTWPLAQTIDRLPDGAQPWIIDLLSLACLVAAIVLPPVGAWIYVVMICLAAGGLRYVADGAQSPSGAVQDTLFNAMTITVFVAIVVVTLRAGARRDEEAERTAAEAIIAAASDAENVERARVAALTHDDVISTLLAAARSTPATGTIVRGYATRALDRLDSLSSTEIEAGSTVGTAEFIEAIRVGLAGLAGTVTFSGTDEATEALPAAAARAMSEATEEAVRNSLRHADRADRAVTRVVTAVARDDRTTVEIVDDGAGFDPRAVSLERFGIRYSIRHRLEAVPGCGVEIESTIGSGTRVVLTWTRDDGRDAR